MADQPTRVPLPGATGPDANPVVAALDEFDARQQARHVEQLGTLRVIVGGSLAGMFVLALSAILIVGATRGVAPSAVADGAVPIMRAAASSAQGATPTAEAPEPDAVPTKAE
jgi:hypothetical protein